MKTNKSSIGLVAIMLLVLAGFAMATPAEAYTYNRQGAVNYAKANWNNDVPGTWYFHSLGAWDCTNFISQSLYNGGGMRQVGNQYWSPSAWFYTGNSRSGYSESWAGVQPFRNFMLSSGRATQVDISPGYDVLPYNVPVQIGDIVQMDFTGDGTWDHTAIITALACAAQPPYGNMLILTYHDANTEAKSLRDIIKQPGYNNVRFRVLLLKNTYS